VFYAMLAWWMVVIAVNSSAGYCERGEGTLGSHYLMRPPETSAIRSSVAEWSVSWVAPGFNLKASSAWVKPLKTQIGCCRGTSLQHHQGMAKKSLRAYCQQVDPGDAASAISKNWGCAGLEGPQQRTPIAHPPRVHSSQHRQPCFASGLS